MCSDYVCAESNIGEGRRFEHWHNHPEWPSTGGWHGDHAEVEQDDGCDGCCKRDGPSGCDDGYLYGFDQEGNGDDIVDDHGHCGWREQDGELVGDPVGLPIGFGNGMPVSRRLTGRSALFVDASMFGCLLFALLL